MNNAWRSFGWGCVLIVPVTLAANAFLFWRLLSRLSVQGAWSGRILLAPHASNQKLVGKAHRAVYLVSILLRHAKKIRVAARRSRCYCCGYDETVRG